MRFAIAVAKFIQNHTQFNVNYFLSALVELLVFLANFQKPYALHDLRLVPLIVGENIYFIILIIIYIKFPIYSNPYHLNICYCKFSGVDSSSY
jgi:hypothetical protein